MEEVAKKHGGKIVFYDNTEALENKENMLKFNSVEEFGKALDSLVIKTSDVVEESKAYINSASKDVILTKDHTMYIEATGTNAGTVRHKVIARMGYNSTSERWFFSSILDQKSYFTV